MNMPSLPFWCAVLIALMSAGCSVTSRELPPDSPGIVSIPGEPDGSSLLERSALARGDATRPHRRVKVAYDGRWSTFPKLTQKVLVDPDFRKASEEEYFPASGRVEQTHRGPGGEKSVSRSRSGRISVSYRGKESDDPEVKAASALVADAYTMFLFGASWLLDNGEDFRYLGRKPISGKECDLVEVWLRPGIGLADEDRAVAWLDAETGLMRRVTFTLNGLESTRGAEVDVTFDDFLTAPDGSRWPAHFVEMVRRPVNTKAHEWWTTSLVVDGVRVK